jgi:hypothetical protein
MHYIVLIYGAVEVDKYTYSSLRYYMDIIVALRPYALPRGETLGYRLNGRLGGPQSQSEHSALKKSPGRHSHNITIWSHLHVGFVLPN